ncbi:MAG: hypothetical protein WED34_15675 [Planctomycetales bacterium]
MSEQSPRNRIARLCNAFRTRMKVLLARTGLARLVALAIVLFAAVAALDWWLHLDPVYRVVALALYLAALGGTLWFTLFEPLRRRWSDAEVLAYVDSTVPESGGMLLDLHELLTERDRIQEVESERGRQLADAAIEDIQAVAEQVRLSEAFHRRTANRWLLGAAGTIALLVVFGLALPEYLAAGAARLFNPFSLAQWPHLTNIDLVANTWTVPQLEPFTVTAHVSGSVPQQVTLSYKSESSGYWVKERLDVQEQVTVQAEDGTESPGYVVAYTFPEVREPIRFTLAGGDFETNPQRIEIIHRPYLRNITAAYSFPSYAGLPDRTVPGGQISGLEGTRVRLTFEASMPLKNAVLVLDESGSDIQGPQVPAEGEEVAMGSALLAKDAQRIPLKQIGESGTTFEHSLMLRKNGKYAVELYEPSGNHREAKPEIYDIRVTPDDPPEIELLAPAGDLIETRQASIDVAFRARDKLGLAKVEFLYRIDEAEPVSLSDRITGPIQQTGTDNTTRFRWELRRMDDLPDSGKLNFFVRVQDNNPTGRGLVESSARQVRLVRPSEFHLEAIEQAKLLEEEARIAWRNQLEAWQLGAKFLESGTGDEDDPVWTALADAQRKSFVAAQQIRYHLDVLTQKHERNHMGRDFMASRLSVISELLNRLTAQEHVAIATGLGNARPKTAAEAQAERLKTTRTQVATAFEPNQKMSVLILERMLRKLYDWRDLQTSTITTKLLYEQQEEVLDLTKEIAPKTIAKEIEDLSDADQEKLITLGKQQTAIFDTETGLEQQLTYLMYKAERQKRQSILEPLRAAFGLLRDRRVNDHLKQAAKLIANNQPSDILKNQEQAVRELKIVQEGLLQAGQKVDQDEELSLAMVPTSAADFDPDLIKPEELAATKPPIGTEAGSDEPLTAGEHTLELPTLPEGTDAVSAAVRLSVELQDNVLARAKYLSENNTDGEMPRFIKLKLHQLQERQETALKGIDQAIDQAQKAKDAPAEALLLSVKEEFEQSQQLIAVKDVRPPARQIQADSIATLKDMLQFLAMTKSIEDGTAENRRLEGVDAFGRNYLLRAGDLDLAVEVLGRIDHARQLQADVVRKLQRFQAHPAEGEPIAKLEQSNRQRAAAAQKQVGRLIDEIGEKTAGLSTEVVERVRQTGVGALAGLKLGEAGDRVAADRNDPQLVASLEEAGRTLTTTLQSLRDLLEERVRTEPEVIAAAEPPKMTPEEFARLTSRDYLAERLKGETSLPPEVRDKMVRALERDFPEKYRNLLGAYYASFVKAQENGAPNGEAPPSDETPDEATP